MLYYVLLPYNNGEQYNKDIVRKLEVGYKVQHLSEKYDLR